MLSDKNKKVDNEMIQSEGTTGVSSQDIQMMIDSIQKKRKCQETWNKEISLTERKKDKVIRLKAPLIVFE